MTESCRGRARARRRRRRPLDGAAASVGRVEHARPGEILLAARADVAASVVARDRGEPLHEARGDGRGACELGGAAEDHLARAEHLREIVGRERDAPLRQIEAELRAASGG